MPTNRTRCGRPAACILVTLIAAGCGGSEKSTAQSAEVERRAAYCYALATLDNAAVFTARDRDELGHETAEARVALAEMRENADARLAKETRTVVDQFETVLDEVERSRFRPGAVEPRPPGAEVEKAAQTIRAKTPEVCGVRLP